MKGIVFTEFLDMVEQKFGYDVVDHIIENSKLESGGVYTSVGTYDFGEMVQLITHLSKKVNADPGDLIKAFGQYIFDTFLKSYPAFFNSAPTLFDFLESIDNHIHVEVLKLYPDAQLPSFETKIENGTMEMIYKSERKLAHLALGLLERTIDHYDPEYNVGMALLNEDGSAVKFTVKK